MTLHVGFWTTGLQGNQANMRNTMIQWADAYGDLPTPTSAISGVCIAIPSAGYIYQCQNTGSWVWTPIAICPPSSLAAGDILYFDGSQFQRLPKGSDGEVLALVSGLPAWTVGALPTSGASATALRFSDPAEKSTLEISFTKLKEVKLTGTIPPQLWISFELRSSNGSYAVQGQIWRNGVAIGTSRLTFSATYQTYGQAFTSSSWAVNDLIQVYVHGDGAETAFVQNLNFYWDFILDATSQDP